MSKTVLVIPDQHAHPSFHNNRADWAGKLIKDLKPEVVVNMGDAADMESLCSYDKGKATFYSRNYQKDIEAHLDFQERLWAPVKKSKKKRPYSIVLVGNHEQRVEKVLSYEPHLKGQKYGISMRDFDFESYYNEVVPYNGATPGEYNLDGVLFAHYFVSGVMGRPVGGEHHAASLISKNYCSSVAAHSHTFDFSLRHTADGKAFMGLVSGVFQDYKSPWAGNSQRFWHRGLAILKNYEGGQFDLEWVSMDRLEREYG